MIGLWLEILEFRMARQRAALPMLEQASGGEDERIFLVGHFDRRVRSRSHRICPDSAGRFRRINRVCAWMVVIPQRRW
jgi:hypothetical protein